MKNALSISQCSHDQARIALTVLNEGLFDLIMHGCFFGRHKTRTHIHSIGTQTQGANQATSIGKTTGSDDRDVNGIPCAGDENQGSDVIFPRMPCCFESIDTDYVASDLFCLDCVSNRCAFMDYFYAR